MDIKTISDNYAAEHTSEIIKSAIASAFADGYKQGYEDGFNARPVEDNLSPKEPNFIDLGLPSGTLWADDFLRDSEGKIKYLTFYEASKLNIPTIKQWEELNKFCKISGETGSHKLMRSIILGMNGKEIHLMKTGYISFDSKIDYPWDVFFILNETNEESEVYTAHLFMEKFLQFGISTNTLFQGYRFPVLLVKSSEKV